MKFSDLALFIWYTLLYNLTTVSRNRILKKEKLYAQYQKHYYQRVRELKERLTQ